MHRPLFSEQEGKKDQDPIKPFYCSFTENLKYSFPMHFKFSTRKKKDCALNNSIWSSNMHNMGLTSLRLTDVTATTRERKITVISQHLQKHVKHQYWQMFLNLHKKFKNWNIVQLVRFLVCCASLSIKIKVYKNNNCVYFLIRHVETSHLLGIYQTKNAT